MSPASLLPGGLELFPHQVRTTEGARRAYLAGARRPLLVMPTGGGKTITACALVDGAVSRKGRRVLWLAHRRELVDQASASLTRIGVPHGVVLAGRAARPELPLQVASVQTITASGERPPADIIFIDEAHHVVAATWRAIVAAYPSAEAIFGLTATPERGDRSPLGDVFDAMVAETTVRDLQRVGILVPCGVIAPAKFQRGLMMPVLEAVAKHAGAPSRAKPTVVFCGTVGEAQKVAAELRAAKYRAACVDGATKAEDRERDLLAFKEGRLDVLVNVLVLTEGWDAPRAEVCILARGCSSAATFLQMVGRVLRRHPGKKSALLVDLRGVVHVHGLPEEDRVFSLTGRGIARQVEEKRAAIAQCIACGGVFLAGPAACVSCGAPLPRRPRETTVQRAAAVQITADNITPIHVKRRVFEDLVAEARAKGWKPTAVGMRFKARFGHWPTWRAA